MHREPRPVLLTGPAGALRRRLGPISWVVLEALLARSTGTPQRCETQASVRSLARDVGVSDDTAARALATLKRDGIVVAVQDRNPSGTFSTGRYLITVPDSITLPDRRPTDHQPTTTTPTTTTTSTTAPSRTHHDDRQLTLTLTT